MNDKKILHMTSMQGYLPPSHILYADDIFIFCRGNIKSLKSLSTFLKTYGDFSSQYVSNAKSSFFLPWRILQDLSPKFNVFFFVVMVVCLSII